jgi:hypothetical protein
MDKETYNGWTNYATWRVNLEWFDGDNEWLEEYLNQEAYEVAQIIQGYVREAIDQQSPESSFANSYANAFLDEVNWFEIAEHLKESHEEG